MCWTTWFHMKSAKMAKNPTFTINMSYINTTHQIMQWHMFNSMYKLK